MNSKKIKKIVFVLLFGLICVFCKAQSTNDILNLLIENKTLTQNQADSIRADYAIKQQATLPDKKIRIDFEYRPRTEFRNGYKQLPNDTTTGAFFTGQRTRLSFNFINENKLGAQFTLQDSRIWGQLEPKNTVANIQIFEAWVEPYINENFSLRIGRQKLSFDNQRLFAENNWTMTGAAHDALNFKYNSDKLSSDLAFAFNQTAEQITGTNYKPIFTNYKFLAVNYLVYKANNKLTLTALNSSDGYQSTTNVERLYYRFTDGGRIEYLSGGFYATLSSYYQWGKNEKGTKLSAYYVQPELRYTTTGKLVIRLGAEILSGTDSKSTSTTDHGFNALYGTGHSFNGSMDLITKFPSETGNAGLFNPYLFFIQTINPKWEARSDFHTFSLMENYYKSSVKIDKFLGFENDWLIGYKPNNYTKLDIGFSYAFVTQSFETIKKAATGSYKHTPYFAFISLTVKPQVFSAIFK